jgi:Fur family transcriptional regulator, ferric uptake regulator
MKKANDIQKMIKDSGLKITSNRVNVMSFLKNAKKPVTVDEVSKSLKINIVTTYRVLESFTSKNLIYQTDFRQGKSFFEFQDKDHHHHHVTCSKCGFRDHVDFCIDENSIQELKKIKTFGRINGHILEFFGICKKCK